MCRALKINDSNVYSLLFLIIISKMCGMHHFKMQCLCFSQINFILHYLKSVEVRIDCAACFQGRSSGFSGSLAPIRHSLPGLLLSGHPAGQRSRHC